jgi:hypothetical protein
VLATVLALATGVHLLVEKAPQGFWVRLFDSTLGAVFRRLAMAGRRTVARLAV